MVFEFVDGDNTGLAYGKDYRSGEWTEQSINYIDLSDLPLTELLKTGYWYNYEKTGDENSYDIYKFDADGNVNIKSREYDTDDGQCYGEYSAYYYDVDETEGYMYMVTKSDLRTLDNQWYYDAENNVLYAEYNSQPTETTDTHYLVHYLIEPEKAVVERDRAQYGK